MNVLDGPVAKFSFELEIQAARHHGTWVKNSFLRNKKQMLEPKHCMNNLVHGLYMVKCLIHVYVGYTCSGMLIRLRWAPYFLLFLGSDFQLHVYRVMHRDCTDIPHFLEMPKSPWVSQTTLPFTSWLITNLLVTKKSSSLLQGEK